MPSVSAVSRGRSGWAIGTEQEFNNDEYQDHMDSESLFEVLERLDSLWGYEIDQNGRTSTQDTYRAFVSTVPNSINVPGLFVCSRYVRPPIIFGDSRPLTRPSRFR